MPAIHACLICGFPISTSRYYDTGWTSILAQQKMVSRLAEQCEVSGASFVIHNKCFGLYRKAQRDFRPHFIYYARLGRCLMDTFDFRARIKTAEELEVYGGYLYRLLEYADNLMPMWVSQTLLEKYEELLSNDIIFTVLDNCGTLLEVIVSLASFKFPEERTLSLMHRQVQLRLHQKMGRRITSDVPLDTIRNSVMNRETIFRSLNFTLEMAEIQLHSGIRGSSYLGCLSRSLSQSFYDRIDLGRPDKRSQKLTLHYRFFGVSQYITGLDITEFTGYPSPWTSEITTNSIYDMWVVYDWVGGPQYLF